MFFEGYGDRRDLHEIARRQLQMCIRDSVRGVDEIGRRRVSDAVNGRAELPEGMAQIGAGVFGCRGGPQKLGHHLARLWCFAL